MRVPATLGSIFGSIIGSILSYLILGPGQLILTVCIIVSIIMILFGIMQDVFSESH